MKKKNTYPQSRQWMNRCNIKIKYATRKMDVPILFYQWLKRPVTYKHYIFDTLQTNTNSVLSGDCEVGSYLSNHLNGSPTSLGRYLYYDRGSLSCGEQPSKSHLLGDTWVWMDTSCVLPNWDMLWQDSVKLKASTCAHCIPAACS